MSSKKFQHICLSLDVNFNESLTNDAVSFEQLGPGKYLVLHKKLLLVVLGIHKSIISFANCMFVKFVCVEVLWPSQYIKVVSKMVT